MKWWETINKHTHPKEAFHALQSYARAHAIDPSTDWTIVCDMYNAEVIDRCAEADVELAATQWDARPNPWN